MGSKKFRVFIVLLVAALLGVGIFAHQRSLIELKAKTAQLEALHGTELASSHLSYVLERYRRESATFRKMSDAEVARAKSELQSSFANFSSSLSSNDAFSNEQIQSNVSALLTKSAEIERMVFSKDAYVKEPIRDLHATIESQLAAIRAHAEEQIKEVAGASVSTESRTLQIFYGSSAAILILVFSLLLENYLVFFRPLRKLQNYATNIKLGEGKNGKSPSLPGVYGEIQVALSKLSDNVEGHLKERHKFIRDVVADLRSPLNMLQSGKDSIKQGMTILSGSLEDLTDIVEINRLENRLNESVVDLSELISDIARTFSGAGSGANEGSKAVSFTVPPMPVWVKIDRRRFERVMIQIVSKVASTLSVSALAAPGAGVHIKLDEVKTGERQQSLEISVFDSSRLGRASGTYISTGPELELLKHWISDNGLGMSLAYKVIRAHNGVITASGVNGTTVQISIRLPAERRATTGLISAPKANNLNILHPEGGHA